MAKKQTLDLGLRILIRRYLSFIEVEKKGLCEEINTGFILHTRRYLCKSVLYRVGSQVIDLYRECTDIEGSLVA